MPEQINNARQLTEAEATGLVHSKVAAEDMAYASKPFWQLREYMLSQSNVDPTLIAEIDQRAASAADEARAWSGPEVEISQAPDLSPRQQLTLDYARLLWQQGSLEKQLADAPENEEVKERIALVHAELDRVTKMRSLETPRTISHKAK